MRRAILLTAVAVTLVLLGSSDTTAATPIPGTPIQVAELDPATKIISLGDQTNFSWVVINSGPRYDISVTATASDAGFSVETYPANFTLRRDEYLIVRVNVTAPAGDTARSATIRITFSTLAPAVSSLQANRTVVARRAPATVDALAAFVAIGGINMENAGEVFAAGADSVAAATAVCRGDLAENAEKFAGLLKDIIR